MDINPKRTEDWRCQDCGKLLAKCQGTQIHIQIGNKHRYVIDGKVTAVCPRCESLNSLCIMAASRIDQ